MLKKSIIIFAVCAMFLLSFAATCSATDDVYSYYKSIKLIIGQKEAEVNYKPSAMDEPAYIKGGRTLVPFRFLGESLGAEVLWNNLKKQATLRLGETEVIVAIGSKAAYVNGKMSTLDIPAEIKGGRTFIPLRFVSEALGATVGYDSPTATVTVRNCDLSGWKEYIAPISEIKYKYPSDWQVTNEENNTKVLFTSPTGSTMGAFYSEDLPEKVLLQKNEDAEENGWTKAGEYFDVPGQVNEGFELYYSIYNSQIKTTLWMVVYCDKMDQGSIVGEVLLEDKYFDMDTIIMSRILYSE